MQRSDTGLFLLLLELLFSQIQGSQFPFPMHGVGGQNVDFPNGPSPKNCTGGCLLEREKTKNIRMEVIKRKILEELKDSEGDVTPVVLLKENNYTATTEPDEDVLEFYLEPPQSGSSAPMVTKAKLFVLIRWRKPKPKRNKKQNNNHDKNNNNKRSRKSKRGRKRILLEIYKVNDADEVPKQQRISHMRVKMHHTKWQELPIPTSVVQETFNSPDHRLLLKVVCKECEKYGKSGPKPVLFYRKKKPKKKGKGEEHYTDGRAVSRDRRQDPSIRASKVHKRGPYMQIRTRQGGKKRARREARGLDECTGNDCVSTDIQVPCHSVSTYVTLDKTDGIVSPQGYYTKHCVGTCDSGGSASKTCCKPLETKPLTVIRETDSVQRTEQLEHLLVTKCGCS